MNASVQDVVAAGIDKSPRITRSTVGVIKNAAAFSKAAGISVARFRHTISSSGVAHTLARHGPGGRELSRGQIAVDASDFDKVSEIVAFPDSISPGDETGHHGEPRIKITKMIEGVNYTYIAEVQRRRHRIEMVTMWKR